MRPIQMSLLWLLCGALLGFGIVGLLTGAVLLPFGLSLLMYLLVSKTRRSWLGLVGLGLGPVILFRDNLVGFNDQGCKVTSGGTVCRAGWAVPGFYVGLGCIALGALIGLVLWASAPASCQGSLARGSSSVAAPACRPLGQPDAWLARVWASRLRAVALLRTLPPWGRGASAWDRSCCHRRNVPGERVG